MVPCFSREERPMWDNAWGSGWRFDGGGVFNWRIGMKVNKSWGSKIFFKWGSRLEPLWKDVNSTVQIIAYYCSFLDYTSLWIQSPKPSLHLNHIWPRRHGDRQSGVPSCGMCHEFFAPPSDFSTCARHQEFLFPRCFPVNVLPSVSLGHNERRVIEVKRWH